MRKLLKKKQAYKGNTFRTECVMEDSAVKV